MSQCTIVKIQKNESIHLPLRTSFCIFVCNKMRFGCAKYEKIGTPEECKIAVEKQRPRKPINPDDDYGTFKCPNCNGLIFVTIYFHYVHIRI